MTEPLGNCIVCMRRDAHEPPACGPCRSRLAGQLRDIPILCEELGGGGFVMRDGRTARPEVRYPPGHERAGELVPHFDQVANVLTAGPMAGQSSAPRVQGSREAPIPISVDRLDLLGPADERTVHDQFGDQIGHQSAATILDGWCRMFAEERRESTPNPKPADQSRWLLDRLDELFKHPAIDEMASEVADLWHVLRRACGLTMPQPELCIGVECKACDLRMLYRIPGSAYIECQCGQLYTEDEYRDWTKLLAAQAKQRTAS